MIAFLYLAIIFMAGYLAIVISDTERQNKEAVAVPLAVGTIIAILFAGTYGILAAASAAAVAYGFNKSS